MKKLTVFFGLVIVLLFTVVAAAQIVPAPTCCTWYTTGCNGSCNETHPLCTFTPQLTKNCTCLSSDTCRLEGDSCVGSCGGDYECVKKYDPYQLPYCECQEITSCHWNGRVCTGYCETGSCVEINSGVCGCEPVVGECKWNVTSKSCEGACGGPEFPCVQIGYDFEQGEGVCECRSGDGCRWNESYNPEDDGSKCIGGCEGNSICKLLGDLGIKEYCDCTEIPSVPEFATPAIAIIVLLTSPVFAYLLLVRRR